MPSATPFSRNWSSMKWMLHPPNCRNLFLKWIPFPRWSVSRYSHSLPFVFFLIFFLIILSYLVFQLFHFKSFYSSFFITVNEVHYMFYIFFVSAVFWLVYHILGLFPFPTCRKSPGKRFGFGRQQGFGRFEELFGVAPSSRQKEQKGDFGCFW